MLNSNLWALLTSSHGLQSGPRSQPRAETSVPTAPNPNKLHRTVGFGKFCFLFPHISGVGVFSKTQTHLLTKREKKLGEQGACGQRSDPSSPRAMPGSPSSLLPAPNGCHRLLLAISRLFVFNIYLHLPFPSHPPPTLLLQQLPHQCTSPGGTQQSKPSQARAPSRGGAPGRPLLLVGGARESRGHPGPGPAPPLYGPLRPPSRPSPTDSGNPKGGKEGRNLTHTKKWGRRVGTERHSKPGVGTEGLGERRKAGGTEGARRKMEGNEQDE